MRKPKIREMMFATLESVREIMDSAVELYRESALCRAICFGLGLLFGLVLFDAVVGFPTGLRMAYVLPLWAATQRGGRHAGGAIILITTILLASIDSSLGRNKGLLPNFAIQTAVMYGLMLIFDRVETGLRSATTMATRDALTGLYNRYELDKRGRAAIDRSTVLPQTLSLAMVDCDRFKELNDQFGHAFGDEVLRLLGKSLRRSLPNDTIIGRAGGDEFIVILPNHNRFEAVTAMEIALDRFMSHTEIIGKSWGFSYGVAVVGENGSEYEKLLLAADTDMYRRKAGRSELSAAMAS